MKRIFTLLFVLTVFAGCNNLEFKTKEFTHTGCNKELGTKADGQYHQMPAASMLILKYEGGYLRVTRRNVYASCGIKSEDGLVCEVSVEGDAIHYMVYETHPANCPCTIDEMSSAVSGLKVGKEYQFYLNYYKPIRFTFNKELFLVLDEESLLYDYAN